MASTNAIQGAPSNLTNTIDGLTYLYSNGNTITGNYLNSNTNTSNVNTQIKLQYAGQFDIQDDTGLSAFNINDISRVTTLARGQQSGAPVVGNDLTNKSYVDTKVGNPINKTGTTTGLNGNAVLSTVSGSTFSFSDGSGNNLVVYGQNSTSCYTAGGIWTVYTSNSPTLALIQCVESTRITSFYNPQSSWAPSDFLDLTNKGYVDSAITTVTSGYWQKTGSIGLSGLYQLLASSSILFQNSSGTSLLTLSGSGCGINNPVITGVTNLFTLYNTYGGSNQLLQIDSAGNLQNCPNLSYTYAGVSSTILTTIPTAIGGQQQTLQWIRNTSSPQGWYLATAYISKFPQTDIPITIPLLYCSTLTTTDWATSYNGTQAVLQTPRNYLKINDTTGNTFSSGTTGFSLNTIINGTKASFINSQNTGIPATGVYGGNGDRLILYPGGIGLPTSIFPYSLGIDSYTLWLSASGNSDFSSANLFNIDFWTGAYRRWRMSGTSSANSTLKSTTTYMTLEDTAGNQIYTNNQGIYINTSTTGIYLPNTPQQSLAPQHVLIGFSNQSLQFGQMSTAQYTNNSVAWTNGYTLSGTFTKNSATSLVTLTGGVSMYCSNIANQSVNVRLYPGTGTTYYTFTQTQFFNIVSSHTFIPTNNTFTNLPVGTYSVYIYATGTGFTSDTNDYYNMTFRVSPS